MQDGDTPLRFAVAAGEEAAVRALLAAGADAQARNNVRLNLQQARCRCASHSWVGPAAACSAIHLFPSAQHGRPDAAVDAVTHGP